MDYCGNAPRLDYYHGGWCRTYSRRLSKTSSLTRRRDSAGLNRQTCPVVFVSMSEPVSSSKGRHYGAARRDVAEAQTVERGKAEVAGSIPVSAWSRGGEARPASTIQFVGRDKPVPVEEQDGLVVAGESVVAMRTAVIKADCQSGL